MAKIGNVTKVDKMARHLLYIGPTTSRECRSIYGSTNLFQAVKKLRRLGYIVNESNVRIESTNVPMYAVVGKFKLSHCHKIINGAQRLCNGDYYAGMIGDNVATVSR